MAQAAVEEVRVPIVIADSGQTVRIPEEFRFASDEVFMRRDFATGAILLSERPQMKQEERNAAWQALFDEIDQIGAHDFVIECDRSLPREVDF